MTEFCKKHNISVKHANKIMLVFEEVKQMLFEKYSKPEIITNIGINKGDINFSAKYKGEKFNITESKDDISLKLVEGLATNIEYSYNEKDEYSNVIELKI